MSTNCLASAVASYTPRFPVTSEQADVVSEKIAAALHVLAEEVDDYLSTLGASDSLDGEGGPEEQVIIITSPPP